jgi:epoxyqueuosine reductase
LKQISQITVLIKQWAHDAGFELAGIAPVHAQPELNYFPEWIAAGHAGEMNYLKARDEAGQLKRASLQTAAPWARSVIVCAINYNTANPYSTATTDPAQGWISRYAWSRNDYHDAVMSKLRTVETKLRNAFRGATAEERATQPATTPENGAETKLAAARRQNLAHGVSDGKKVKNDQAPEESKTCCDPVAPVPALITRCYVDTGPLVERVYAKYAGVGWIGKNTCILNQKQGSWLFLGVVLTSQELEPDLPAPDRCGTCTRCIEACPTHAFVAPYQLDSNKCISYLTIEKRGSIPEGMREGMGRHIFGCDICQDVCPWNRKAPATTAPEFQPREGLVNPALEWLAEISEEEFREKFRGSPIRRTKRTGLRRNALVAMGNSGNHKFLPALEKLKEDVDPTVAEAAAWALEKLTI